MDCETKERLKALRENMKSYGYIDGVEELESIFPQLVESEDERIRKELIEFIKWSVDRHFMREDFHQAKRPSEWIAYLEKQKEQKPKDVEEKYIDGIKRDWFERGKKEVLTVPELYGLEKQKEQKHYWKPTETDVALFNKAVTTNKALTPTERAQLDIIRSKFSCCRVITCGGIVQEEQKLAWSEEDERMLSRCEKSIESSKQFADSDTFKKAKDNEIDWLENRFKSLRSRPKQEWSEEDEKMIDNLIRFFNEKLVILGEAENAENTVQYVSYKKVIDWLKSLRPSWKPSEEQIEELWNVISYIEQPDSNYLGVPELLESLYEELKKL